MFRHTYYKIMVQNLLELLSLFCYIKHKSNKWPKNIKVEYFIFLKLRKDPFITMIKYYIYFWNINNDLYKKICSTYRNSLRKINHTTLVFVFNVRYLFFGIIFFSFLWYRTIWGFIIMTCMWNVYIIFWQFKSLKLYWRIFGGVTIY